MNSLLRTKFYFRTLSLFSYKRAFFCSKYTESSTINLKKTEELESIISKSTLPVMVDFYADWCGPCKKLGPVLDEKLKEKNFILVKVNVDNHGELAEKYNVGGIPFVLLYKNGKKLKEFAGFNTQALNDMIAEI